MKVLLDHNLPRQLASLLADCDVKIAAKLGWEKLVNGELLAQAEAAGFDCLITGDQNLAYQQNLKGRRIGVLVLNTIQWGVLRQQGHTIVEALGRVSEGAYIELALKLPPLRRRPYHSPRSS